MALPSQKISHWIQCQEAKSRESGKSQNWIVDFFAIPQNPNIPKFKLIRGREIWQLPDLLNLYILMLTCLRKQKLINISARRRRVAV